MIHQDKIEREEVPTSPQKKAKTAPQSQITQETECFNSLTKQIQELQLNDQLFRTIAETAPIGIIQTDTHNEPLFINAQFCNFIGLDPLDQIAQKQWMTQWKESIHPEDRPIILPAWKKAFESHQDFHREYRFLSHNGPTWVLAYAKPLKQPDGSFQGWLTTITDITMQKQLEQRTKQNLVDQIGKICHEIRNPLNAILGNLELLESDIAYYYNELLKSHTRDNGQLLQALFVALQEKQKDMMSGVEHQRLILDDVLTLQRLTAEKEEINAIPTDLRVAIENVISIERGNAKQKNLDLFCIWQTDEEIVVKTDPNQFKRILINFISNSIKYTNNGSITVSTAIHEKAIQYTAVRVTIEDTGIGMSVNHLKNIYTPFWRASSQHTGTGIGLSLNKALIEKMGGSLLEVHSILGRGSRFGFIVPCQNLSQEEQKHFEQRHPTPPKNRPNLLNTTKILNAFEQKQSSQFLQVSKPKTLRCLIVDDSEINRTLLSKLLQRIFNDISQSLETQFMLECDHAENGIIAYTKFFEAKVLKKPFDIIFMDIVMPYLNGLDTVREIRLYEQTHPSLYRTHIIGLSGNATKKDKKAAQEVEIDQYLTKPYTFSNLKETILKQLEIKTYQHSPKTPVLETVLVFAPLSHRLSPDYKHKCFSRTPPPMCP